jgi:fructose-1,6-bisphosphatase I
MTEPTTLAAHLALGDGADERADVARTIMALAGAGLAIAKLAALGPLAGELGAVRGENLGGDTQKEMDLRSHALAIDHLARAPVMLVGSEESDEAVFLDPAGTLAVAIDPLDGSSNIETNAPIGTIFSILPVGADPAAALLQPGTRQSAAGFFIYGPQTALVLTIGRGTEIFVLDRRVGEFVRLGSAVAIPPDTEEFAINASNQRHWPGAVRSYIDDCLAGADGLRGKNYNMRWIASLVADAFRILRRGGIYLYPADARQGYQAGRLRLVYEANPIAFLVEQAGGAATDGQNRILDLQPRHLHERTPLVFGSRHEVERVARHHSAAHLLADHAPLFGQRGLLRA